MKCPVYKNDSVAVNDRLVITISDFKLNWHERSSPCMKIHLKTKLLYVAHVVGANVDEKNVLYCGIHGLRND